MVKNFRAHLRRAINYLLPHLGGWGEGLPSVPQTENGERKIALKIQENVSNFKNFSPEALLGTAGLEVIFGHAYICKILQFF